MKEDERIKTLEELKKNRSEMNEMLQKMPLSMKTDTLKNRKREMEQKLTEIEKAITTFSRKVVYVADNQ